MASVLLLAGLIAFAIGVLIQIGSRGYFDWLFGSRRTRISDETYWIDMAGRVVAIIGLFLIVGSTRVR